MSLAATRPVRPAAPRSRNLVELIVGLKVWPFFAVAGAGLLAAFLVLEADFRLMATAWSAAAFNAGTILFLLKRWRSSVVMVGLVLNFFIQSLFLGTICIPGALDYLWFYQPYTILLGRENYVFLSLVAVSLAVLTIVPARMVFSRGAGPEGAAGTRLDMIAADRRLPWLLGAGAVFTLLFWAGSLLDFGVLKAVLQVLQRAFTLVPFLAGFYFRRLGWVGPLWWVVLAINVALGIATGSRGPAFLPIIFYVIGLVFGARGRERFVILGLLALVALPGSYIFGMIEVIRTDVGRLSVGDLSTEKISQVASRMADGRKAGNDEYEELPAWVRTNIRVVTWPTLVVAVVANGAGSQRGYADIPDQVMASLNVVALTGRATSYYNEGLFNLRASDYGFRVDEGTSVEFGLIAEAWDRGGFWGAYAYALFAVLFLWATEALVRRFLTRSPALLAIALSVAFSTALLTLNIYNLPLSLRHMVVNLIVCFAIFGVVSAFSVAGATAVSTPQRVRPPGPEPRLPVRRS